MMTVCRAARPSFFFSIVKFLGAVMRLLNYKNLGRCRPQPPAELLGPEGAVTPMPIRPANDLASWVRATFIEPEGQLANEDHAHLRFAYIGMLWAAVPNARKMNSVLGEAEIPMFRCSKRRKAWQEQQVIGWFGEMPNFLITVDANYAAGADGVSFAALIEHELAHCGQELDVFGAPKFRKDGRPAFALSREMPSCRRSWKCCVSKEISGRAALP
jgi:hypothetical protein